LRQPGDVNSYPGTDDNSVGLTDSDARTFLNTSDDPHALPTARVYALTDLTA
jgi:hypothetical protein